MKLTFVHLVDPIRFDPATALLASVARAGGCEIARLGADFGTDTAKLLEDLLGTSPDLVCFRIDGLSAAVVGHMIAELRDRSPEVAIALHGTLCERPTELPLADRRVIALLPDAAAALEGLIAAWDGGLPETLPAGCVRAGDAAAGTAWDPAGKPLPDLEIFDGVGNYRHGTSGSFFGEVGVATLETRIGSVYDAAPDAGLALFNLPTTHPPRPFDTAAILARLEQLGDAVRHVEIHDRAFAEDIPRDAALLAEIMPALRRRTLTLRVLPGRIGPSFAQYAGPERIRRIVLEIWAATPELASKLPGTPDPVDVQLLAAAIRARGIDVGLLVPVGLPWETPADVDAKLAAVADAGAVRARFVPFEPVPGTELHDLCIANAMLPTHPDAWNREVYSPLVHDGMPIESWYECWQRCLDLQAALQLAHPADLEFVPGATA